MDSHIGIQTSADLSGVNAVKQGLIEIRNLAQEIAKHGIAIPNGGGASGGMPQTFTETAKQRIGEIQQQVVGSTIGMQSLKQNQIGWNYQPPTGVQVGQWMEQNMPIINSMMGYGSTGNTRVPRPQKYAAKPGTIPSPQNINRQYRGRDRNTPEYYNDWFIAIEKNLRPGSVLHDEWQAANIAWLHGEENAPQTFHNRHSTEANMIPVPQPPPPTAFEQFHRGLMRGGGSNSLAGMAGTAVRSMLPYSFRRGLTVAGGLSGDAVGEAATAGMAGTALGGIALGLGVGGAFAVGGLAVNSFNQYMDSGRALSDLTKQILTTKDSLETLQSTVNSTGAAMGYLPQQTAQIAATLGTAYGSLSLSQLNNNVAQVAGMSRAYGVPADVLAQGFAGAAQMGLTTGIGSTMTQGQLALTLANSAGASGMSGRMADLMQELLMVTQGTQATNPVANPESLLNIITAMNGNLPRSMTGAGGAQILNQLGQGMARPGGSAGMMLEFEALQSSGINDYWQMRHAMQMGPGYKLPNGQTMAQVVLDQINRTWPGAKFGSAESGYQPLNSPAGLAENVLQELGLSMPQAGAMLSLSQSGGFKNIQNNLGISAQQLQSVQDWGKMALLGQLNNAQSETEIQGVISQFTVGGGQLTDEQKTALAARAAKGDISGERALLGQNILNGTYSPLTKSEQVNQLNADITSAQINIVGTAVSGKNATPGVVNGAPPTDSDIYNGAKRGGVTGARGFDITPPQNSDLDNALRRGGVMGSPSRGFIDDASHTAYTPGGYMYSPAVIATAMGINGLHNAFAWMSAKGSTQGTPEAVQVSTKPSNPYGDLLYKRTIPNTSVAFSGNSDFLEKMRPYAQQASLKTGLPTSYILAQWVEESGWGTSEAAKDNLNFAGITAPAGSGLTPGMDSAYAGFSNIDDFVRAYIDTINSPRYSGARSAAANGASATKVFGMLQEEGYAEDHNYGNAVGGVEAGISQSVTALDDQSISKLAKAIGQEVTGGATNWSKWQTPRYTTQ